MLAAYEFGLATGQNNRVEAPGVSTDCMERLCRVGDMRKRNNAKPGNQITPESGP